MRFIESYFRPYLICLPRTFSTPLYWSVDSFRALFLSDRVNAQRAAHTVRAAAGLYLRLLFTMRSLSASLSEPTPFPSWSQFRWAMAAATTRQNRIPLPGAPLGPDGVPGVLALVPGWDFINHDGNLAASTSFVTEAGKSLDGSLQFAAAKSFCEGQELLMNYGHRSNAELLIYAGFAISDNIEDTISINAMLPSDLGRLRALLFERLMELCLIRDRARGDASCGDAKLAADTEGNQYAVFSFGRVATPPPCCSEKWAMLPPAALCAAIAAALTKEQSGSLLKDILGGKYAVQEGEAQHAVDFCRSLIVALPADTQRSMQHFLDEAVVNISTLINVGVLKNRSSSDFLDSSAAALNSYFIALVNGQLGLATEFSAAVASIFAEGLV